MLGISTMNNGIVNGTKYSWKPSNLFNGLIAIPVKGPSRIPAY